MERFLYRLSTTHHRARIVIKGALMLHVWDAPLARATKDLDVLGRLDNSLENVDRVAREICSIDVLPDGMVFDPTTVRTERIKEDAEYEGVRVRFVGLLGKARVAMQIDIGFGDVITPDAQDITYPTLLDFPAPALSGYPRETVVAEKFQAMVYLRTLNSRMKDFYDVWLLARQFSFDGALLANAIAATFGNRGTTLDAAPITFTPEFTAQEMLRCLKAMRPDIYVPGSPASEQVDARQARACAQAKRQCADAGMQPPPPSICGS
jgi:hypothetical protein